MGQCGCGDFNAQYRLPGPDGDFYALQVYPGCDYCNTPAGLIIHRFDEKEAKRWSVPDLPELEADMDGKPVVIIDADILKQKLQEFNAEHGGEYDLDGFIEDGVDCSLREAVFDTFEKFKGEANV